MKRSWQARSIGLSCLYLVCGTALAGEAADSAPVSPAAVPEPDEPQMPEVRTLPEAAPALQMAPDFTSPALAFGGYFPMPQMESGTMRVEPFNIRAAVNAGLGYDDNVTLSRSNQISSMLMTVTPAVVVGLEGASQRYYAVYRGNYGRYFSSPVDNYENHNLGLVAAHDWTTRFRTAATYDFTRGHDPRGAILTSGGPSSTWNLHRLRASGSYGAEGAQGRVDGYAGYTKREYADSGGLPDTRNYDQIEVGSTLGYRVGPKTMATLTLQHSDFSHADAPQLDASENRYLVGATWEALAKTRGLARIGYFTRSASGTGASTFSGATYEVAAVWSPLTYSTVNLTATRTSSEAIEAGSSFIVVDVATVTWEHAWFDRVRSTVRGLYGEQIHQGLDRKDTYYSLSGRVSYAFHRRLRLGAEFRHDNRQSPDPLLEFKRNVTSITLESSL
jgi:hypothetical protein